MVIGEVQKAIQPLLERWGIELLVLFGSSASQARTRPEDLDLALLGPEPLDLVALTNEATQLLGTQAVDLVDLRRAPPLLAMEIVRSGTVVFEHEPGTFARFASLAARRYADTEKLRLAQREAIEGFIRERGLS